MLMQILVIVHLHTKFELPSFIRSKNKKDDLKVKTGVIWFVRSRVPHVFGAPVSDDSTRFSPWLSAWENRCLYTIIYSVNFVIVSQSFRYNRVVWRTDGWPYTYSFSGPFLLGILLFVMTALRSRRGHYSFTLCFFSFFSFLHYCFRFLVPWGRLSWLFVSFLAYVNIVYCIVSYRHWLTAYTAIA